MKKQKNLWPLFIVLVVCFGVVAFGAWYIDVNSSPEKSDSAKSAETMFAPGICTRDRRHICAISDDVV